MREYTLPIILLIAFIFCVWKDSNNKKQAEIKIFDELYEFELQFSINDDHRSLAYIYKQMLARYGPEKTFIYLQMYDSMMIVKDHEWKIYINKNN